MSKKLTVASRDEQLVAVNGGRKKATAAGAVPIVVLYKKETRLVWRRLGSHWWSLPVWSAFHRTSDGVIVRRPCILDVLG